MTLDHHFVVTRNELVMYEDFMHPIVHIAEEIANGERDIMLCSYQHNRRMLKKISTGTSESHVFEIDYWCMFAGIEAQLDDVFMQFVKHKWML